MSAARADLIGDDADIRALPGMRPVVNVQDAMTEPDATIAVPEVVAARAGLNEFAKCQGVQCQGGN